LTSLRFVFVFVALAVVAPSCAAAPPAPRAAASNASNASNASSSSSASSASPASAPAKRPVLRFASAAEGKAILESEDDFTRMLSAFDRSLRMKRTDAVPDAEYRRFAGEQAVDFTVEDQAAWGPAVEDLRRGLERLEGHEALELGLPPLVLVIKTTGREELDAAYTRRNAIILPATMVATFTSASRVSLLAHELFHVSSRASPALRDRCYALLGFAPMPAITPPREVTNRLTNPDAHGLAHYVRLTGKDAAEHALLPLLRIDLPLEQAIAAKPWFKALRVVLVEVDPAKGTVLVDASGKTRTLDVDATDWSRRLAKNTDYVIHPEEVLADNFALVVQRRLGRPVKAAQPDFLDVLEGALRAPLL
jgi:hypothetical protein